MVIIYALVACECVTNVSNDFELEPVESIEVKLVNADAFSPNSSLLWRGEQLSNVNYALDESITGQFPIFLQNIDIFNNNNARGNSTINLEKTKLYTLVVNGNRFGSTIQVLDDDISRNSSNKVRFVNFSNNLFQILSGNTEIVPNKIYDASQLENIAIYRGVEKVQDIDLIGDFKLINFILSVNLNSELKVQISSY